MKNIIIAGPARAGKTTLAKRINEELKYFVIHLDKLMTVFDKAYPQLDIRIAWDRHKATKNISPFIGHYLGMLSCNKGFANDLNLHKHYDKHNNLVLEGGHLDLEIISSILKSYSIEDIKDEFILIGLVQNNKTEDEFFRDLRKYDTKDEWTYDHDDIELRELIINDFIPTNQYMNDYLKNYGFTVYDTSSNREQVLDQIIEDIKSKLV